MQIDGQGVHGDHLDFTGADELCERGGKRFVIVNPGTFGMVMAEDAQAPPIRQFLVYISGRRPWLQAQRMTAEVHDFAPPRVVRMMKLRGQRRQRVPSVERQCGRRIEFGMFQGGAAITVPQRLQVRRSTLE